MDPDQLLQSAKIMDEAIAEVWAKYQDKRELEGENWLLEYAILNWGKDFYPAYNVLKQFQIDLKSNIGKWGYSRDDMTGEKSYQHNLIVFQISEQGLVPGKVTKLPESNYERPSGFQVSLGYKVELEMLLFDQYGSNKGYYVDADEGVVFFSDDVWKNIRKDSEGLFKTDFLLSPCCGPRVVEEIGLGDITLEKMSTLMKIIGYQPGEAPLECIRRQKDKTLLKPTQYIDLFFSGL